jgi:hypothetical protein
MRQTVAGSVLVVMMVCLTAGCAVHYFDAATGTEHIWGVGHMKMKAASPAEGLRAVVRGTDLVGVSVGRTDRQFHVTLGWNRLQRLDVLAEDVSLLLEWPSSDFVSVRVGTRFPLERPTGQETTP